jgi:Glycosyl hydrolase 2 galactose-binding domain-like
MYPHRIRLRGPWEYQVVSGDERHAHSPLTTHRSTTRLIMPCRWRDGGLIGFAGKIRLHRRFGAPRLLDGYERVWLTCEGADGTVTVWVNGKLLGQPMSAAQPFEFQVTEHLQERNELIVEIESENDSGGLWGEVALEIRCLAFLRNVRARTAPPCNHIIVEGLVVGVEQIPGLPVPSPLEVYMLLGRSTIAYGGVTASERGQAFRLVSEDLVTSSTGEVVVQLVCGATVWHSCQVPVVSSQLGNQSVN